MTQVPRGPEKLYCPLWRKPMCKVCHECPLWIQVRGVNPNDGKEIDKWDCSLALMPVLTIENSFQQRATGAAIESFRNEVVALNTPPEQRQKRVTHT